MLLRANVARATLDLTDELQGQLQAIVVVVVP